MKGAAQLLARADGTLKVRLKARRTSAALPHAVHIHGKDAPEIAHCPGADRRDDIVDDLNADGAYGGRTTVLNAPLEGELPVACGELVKRGS